MFRVDPLILEEMWPFFKERGNNIGCALSMPTPSIEPHFHGDESWNVWLKIIHILQRYSMSLLSIFTLY